MRLVQCKGVYIRVFLPSVSKFLWAVIENMWKALVGADRIVLTFLFDSSKVVCLFISLERVLGEDI